MSAPLAGRFQDHYQVLGIDAKADSAAIERAFRDLSARYDPANADTGDKDKLEAVKLAYEVLSDPELRKSFDALRGGPGAEDKLTFSGAGFFRLIESENARRLAILCILYDRRLRRPSKPGLSLRQLESMIHATPDQLQFAMWYLKQRGQVASDDKSNVAITFAGIDFLESCKPHAEDVMAVLKASCVEADETARQPEPAPPPAQAPAAPDGGETHGELASLAVALETAAKPAQPEPRVPAAAAPQKQPAPAATQPRQAPFPPAQPVHSHVPKPAPAPVRRVISIPPRRPNPSQ